MPFAASTSHKGNTRSPRMWTSSSAASISSVSISSRAAAMFGAGPATSHPSSIKRSAVNGPTTGESSTMRIRRPLSEAAFGLVLVDEPRDDIAIGTRDLHLRSRIQHQEAFAVGVRLHLAHQVEVDDGRAVDALKAARVQPLLEVL